MIVSKRELQFKYLGISFEDLKELCNGKESYYRTFKLTKKDASGKPKVKNGVVQKRTIDASIGKLKVIQKRTLEKVLPLMPLPDFVQGGVKGRSNIQNAKLHQGRKYRFSTDIKKCFPSITTERVKNMLLSYGFSQPIAWILAELTTYKGKLCQGAPTSSYIANLVLLPTDYAILDSLKEQQVTYSRWIDDINISSAKDFESSVSEIVAAITGSGYAVSRAKTSYRSKKSTITGVVVGNNGLDVTDDFKAKGALDLNEHQVAGRANYYKRVKNPEKYK